MTSWPRFGICYTGDPDDAGALVSLHYLSKKDFAADSAEARPQTGSTLELNPS